MRRYLLSIETGFSGIGHLRRTSMKSVISALVALSVLTALAAPASAKPCPPGTKGGEYPYCKPSNPKI
jgi:hypothetical protein